MGKFTVRLRPWLFEWEDQPWFPQVIRQGGMDYLRFVFTHFPVYDAALPVLRRMLVQSGQQAVMDLCSGGAGPWPRLLPRLQTNAPHLQVWLSDLYPPGGQPSLPVGLHYLSQAHNALAAPPPQAGLRTCFSALHHFSPPALQQMLVQATEGNQPVAFFDGARQWWLVPAILVLHPLAFLLCTPFFRPFRWSNLFFTYLLPLIPLYTVWDGVVSVLRLHPPEQLLALARQARPDYEWQSGYLKQGLLSISFLSGRPTSPATPTQ